MSNGRDWRSFNDAWRNRNAERTLDQTLQVLRSVFDATERAIIRLEPLGILLAVIGLSVTIVSFQIDYQDRSIDRKLRAWEIVTANREFSGAKDVAANFLVSSGNDLSFAKLVGDRWDGKDLAEVDLTKTDLSESLLNGSNLNGSIFRRTKFNFSWFMSVSLVGAVLFGADLTEAFLKEANLSGASSFAADLVGANFEDADLEDAYFARSDFQDANLSGAELKGTDFEQANLSGADLRYTSPEQGQLTMACGNEETLLPDGLTIPMCVEVDWFEADPNK
jgi:uncharacterized protein YjbI with pentapeptide repeats